MNPRRIAPVLLLSLFAIIAGATDTKEAHLSKESRMEIIRSLNAEHIFVRTVFPMGKTGLTLKDGKVVAPTAGVLQQLLADNGPAARPGDRAMISNIEFKGSAIRFEINGGPQKKQKWYQRIQVGGMGGQTVPLSPTDSTNNPRGSFVDLVFEKYVPDMTPQQVKQLLAAVFDFNAKSAAEAYMATLPPKVKDAIKNHQVLVGMDREMVTYAKGRPPKKVRERDGTTDYEEWIYGAPPEDVEFVRLIGDQVVRVETMKVDGEKLVRTEREVEIKRQPTVAETQAQSQPRPANAPTLRRPGEESPDNSPAGGVAPMPAPPVTQTPAPSGGGDPTQPH